VSAIPDRILFVWTGARFPYFARLAVESALLAEPTAEIELHLFGARPDGAPHFEAVRARDRVAIEMIDLDRVFDGLDVDPRALRATFDRLDSPAARANLIRYAVLAHRGGIYLDTDVLVVRSLADLRGCDAFAGEEQVLSIDERRVAGELELDMLAPAAAWAMAWGMRRLDAALGGGRLEPLAQRLDPHWQITQLNNAVIGARPGASFVRRLLARATEVDARIRYRLGPTLISEVARADRRDVTILPSETFYVVPPSYSFRFFTGGAWPIPDATRLLHVVSSNHRALLDGLDEATVRHRAPDGVYYALAAELATHARALPGRRDGS